MWKDSWKKIERSFIYDDQSLVIGVLFPMGLLKLDAGDFCLCMRRLCKNLRISAKQKIDCHRVSYFQFESMVRNAGSLFTVHFGVLWGFIVNVSTYLSDSNLVDSASSIRLSQRLSHACLSINNSILWNCEWLIISVIVYLIVPYYLDNRSNSRANTCINTQLSWKGSIY